MATAFEATFERSPVERLVGVGWTFTQAYSHLPALLPGAIVGVVALAESLRRRSIASAAFLLALAIVPASTVLVQAPRGAWYGYHFAAFLPTVLVLLLVALSEFDGGRLPVGNVPRRPTGVALTIVALGLFWLAMTSPVALFDGGGESYERSLPSSSDSYRDIVADQRGAYEGIGTEFGLDASDEVLYLSDGVATYYLRSESHLRYYYPLPIQRVDRNPALRESNVYRETVDAALRYEGRVVVHQQHWLELSDHPPLEQKIDREYCLAARENATVQAVSVYVRRTDSTC